MLLHLVPGGMGTSSHHIQSGRTTPSALQQLSNHVLSVSNSLFSIKPNPFNTPASRSYWFSISVLGTAERGSLVWGAATWNWKGFLTIQSYNAAHTVWILPLFTKSLLLRHMKQLQMKLHFLGWQLGTSQRNGFWKAGNGREAQLEEYFKPLSISETQRKQCKGENCFCGSSLLISIVINKTTCCTETWNRTTANWLDFNCCWTIVHDGQLHDLWSVVRAVSTQTHTARSRILEYAIEQEDFPEIQTRIFTRDRQPLSSLGIT